MPIKGNLMDLKKVIGLAVGVFLCWNVAANNEVELNPSHPDEYMVVKGDTLWDISARFLRTPWRWPDIWQVNEQIENPHLIYPGDVIELAFVDGKPVLRLKGRDKRLSPAIRRLSIDEAIPMIPVDAIAAFLNSPRVMTEDEFNSAPYVVAFEDTHILGSANYKAYVRSLDENAATGYSVVRQGEEYKDGETGESLGFESIFIAESAVERLGDPATVMLSKTTREVRKGDRLLVTLEGGVIQNYYPHVPTAEIKGRIIGAPDGVMQISKFDVVAIDRGQQDGVEVGHVLQIDQAGENIRDVVAGGAEKVKLPDEKSGVLMVFRVFERVSYGLVMEGHRVIHRLDVVRTP